MRIILVLCLIQCCGCCPKAPSRTLVTPAEARSLAAELDEMIAELRELDDWGNAKEIERLERERDELLRQASRHK